MTTITDKLAEALRKQHESHLTYSEAKRRANATCGDFKESALSALIESGYLASELGKETIAALAAFKESRGGPDTKSAVSGVQRVGVASELLDPSLHSLDAWECEACDGAGSISEPGVVTIANGEKHKSGWVDSTCPTCGGLKYCGPDAEALAAYASQQADQYPDAGKMVAEPSDAMVEAYTSEKHFALRGAYCIAAGDAYFEARPFAPGDPRITFDAGFVRGFDKATELADARAVLQAADAVSAPGGPPTGYESTTPAYIRWVSPERYAQFKPEVQKWYRPYWLAADAVSAGVPEGFVLVPVEPTPEMLKIRPRHGMAGSRRALWASMLAAAPGSEPSRPSNTASQPGGHTSPSASRGQQGAS